MVRIPFDDPSSKARFEIDIDVDSIENGDGIILAANKDGLLALADIFTQLANENEAGTHLHIGYSEEVPQGPGWRIMLSPSGRIRET